MARVVVYSGGMDSCTLLHDVIARHGKDDLHAISFNYGQRHKRELEYAQCVTTRLGIPHKTVDLTGLQLLLGGSSLTDENISVPEGHYTASTMKQTVVPGRNTIMLSIAMGYCQSLTPAGSSGSVYYGAHSGDHAIYPDCRRPYFEAMANVFTLASEDDAPVSLRAPYMDMNKISILKRGLELGVNYAETLTCYNGREKACGKCGSCQERLEAFQLNGITDPLEYE